MGGASGMCGDGEVLSRRTGRQRVAESEVTRSATQCVWSVGDGDLVAMTVMGGARRSQR